MDITIDALTIEGETFSEERLRIILAHYDALHILIASAKKHGDYEALRKWDEARNRSKQETNDNG